MAGGTILLTLLVAAQSPAPRAESVRTVASASVTILAAEEIRFAPQRQSAAQHRSEKSVRRTDNGRTLIEFY
jgi:hypothetical protein